MGMNPDTNRLEVLHMQDELQAALERSEEHQLNAELAALMERVRLIRPDGTPVPEHWTIFTTGEHVTLKNYTFKIAYIGETSILLEPVGPVLVGQGGSVTE